MPVRITSPDPRADAIRGTLALERGPLVYCVETADLPAGIELEEVAIDPTVAPAVVTRDDVAPRMVGLRLPAWRRAFGDGPAGATRADSPIEIGAIPYFAWGNRTPGAMRVWIPRRDR